MKIKRSLKIFAFSLFFVLPYFAYTENEQSRYLFEIAKQAVCGESDQSIIQNPSEVPYQKSLKQILGRNVFVEGKLSRIVDLYFPQYAGEISSSGFYDAHSDSAQWVEALLVHIEEERIAEELKKMEGELDEYNNDESEDSDDGLDESENDDTEISGTQSSEPLEAENIEKFFSEEKEGIIYTDRDKQLRMYQFENEVLMRQDSKEGYSILNSNGSKVVRNIYDEKMRLSVKEKWNVKNIGNPVLEKKEKFIYDGDSYRVVTKENTEGEKLEKIKYSEKGLVESVNTFALHNKKSYQILKRLCSYNDEGKILSDEITEYTYNDNYKKQTDQFSKKYIYKYNAEGIPPDLQYFENEDIKMRNKYSDEPGTYTKQVFFDDGFSVKSYYENDKCVKETYYRGKNVIREKVYETSKNVVQ